MFAGLRKPTELIVLVVTLLSYGCPVQAIVQAFGLDERTVARWRDRAGAHCEQVHHAVVEQGGLELMHVQADEIRVKGRGRIMWMALAMMVSTRLWVAGVVSPTRDRQLADRLMQQVRSCAQRLCPRLLCTDGWSAYPGSIRRAFRKTGQSDSRTRTRELAGLAAVAYWDGHQTYAQEASHPYHPSNDPWAAGPGHGALERVAGRNGVEHRLH